MSGYEYDVFISFPSKGPAGDWVKKYFHHEIAAWLPESAPVDHDPSIFVSFETIETGAEWPAFLQRALKGSRCLLPVFCPNYFRSPWCCSELQTMREREARLGLRTPHQPRGVIYPVVFADGEHFPDIARNIQCRDLVRFANNSDAFKNTSHYSDFVEEIKQICKELSRLIMNCPAWEEGWPTVNTDQLLGTKIPQPRIG